MKQAIVIDSSREIPLELYRNEHIFPVGYSIEDSKKEFHYERESVDNLHTDEMISVVNGDKKARIFAPDIKEFVELYTFLAEEYDSLISIHSSYFTPAVYEHALVAKKMVSGITIDLVDSPTIGSAAGLFTSELIKFIPKASTINDIRKKAIDLNRNINAYTITENDKLVKEVKDRENVPKSSSFPLRNYNLYHYFHTNWEIISTNRKSRNLFKDVNSRINLTSKTKEISKVYYSTSSNHVRETKETLRRIRKVEKTETHQSLISRYLLGKDFSSIAFL